ncbi:hypothetical protein GCM10011352_18860 [Marinobacterium zhoushanense]|uniref:Tetratricopeptide repeat protein n=1 Tax=Marinobacterium zhoushanense TaxID=1679163 RepID=A0ABQ1KA70_9GAMM|nr:hypothetical protein [Marinobacterium zhoushanense]GGB93002.1 hypothetical protein GCM10011352_18860 [Marinobacterium zhoushanense]
MDNIALLEGKQRYFSDNLPDQLSLLLYQASTKSDPLEKEHMLLDALARWPGVLDTYIALYKLYFRTARYREAECQVWRTLNEASRQGGFSRNYRLLSRLSAPWLEDQSVARLYLFSLKALGVIRLRRGRVKLAHGVLSKLLELDPTDEIGGSNFLGIAESILEDESLHSAEEAVA